MERNSTGILLAMLGALVLPLQACADVDMDPLPKVIVPLLQGAVVLDGKLDESVWAQAVTLRFAPVRKNVENAQAEPALLRLWYDDEALYLGWACEDSDLRSTMTARDSRFWEEEVVEAFLTRAELAEYFELEWNALGGVFDAVILNNIGADGMSLGINGDWDWTAEGMESAARFKGTMMNSDDQDEGWWAEVRVPFSDLGSETPAPGETWRANFFRINRYGWQAPVSSAWSPPPPGTFHQPAVFGFLVFNGEPGAVEGADSSSNSHSQSHEDH